MHTHRRWPRFILLFQVDLLIATCGLASAGHLRDSANVLPCAGNNPYTQGSAECSTEMQLYSGFNEDIMILQQRAPPMLGRYVAQHFSLWASPALHACMPDVMPGHERYLLITDLCTLQPFIRAFAGRNSLHRLWHHIYSSKGWRRCGPQTSWISTELRLCS